MLKELTDKQKSKIPEFCNKWLEIGLSTEPANHEKVEQAINTMYRCGGLEPPSKIVWYGSPFSSEITDRLKIEKVTVINHVRNYVLDSVSRSVRRKVDSSIINFLFEKMHSSLGLIYGGNSTIAVRTFISSVVPNLHNTVVYGQHEVKDLYVFDFLDKICGLSEQIKPLYGLFSLAKYGGWVLTQPEFCLAIERPCFIGRDNLGRIHNSNGPAVLYPDGWSIYATHGDLDRVSPKPLDTWSVEVGFSLSYTQLKCLYTQLDSNCVCSKVDIGLLQPVLDAMKDSLEKARKDG